MCLIIGRKSHDFSDTVYEQQTYSLFTPFRLRSRWLCAMKTETMKPSCLPAAARTADGPVLVVPTRGVAWRGDAAGDIRSRIAEATLLPQHHPAALTLMQAASCPSVANVLKTSVKGEATGGDREKWESEREEKKLYPCFHFSSNLVWSWF